MYKHFYLKPSPKKQNVTYCFTGFYIINNHGKRTI